MHRQTNGWTEGLAGKRTDGWMDGRTEEQMDGRTDERASGQAGGRTDRQIVRVHFFGKNPNPDSESKNGLFVSLAKSKKGL